MIGRIKLYEMGCLASLLMQFFDNNANIIDGNIKTSYRMHQSSDCKYKMISGKAAFALFAKSWREQKNWEEK